MYKKKSFNMIFFPSSVTSRPSCSNRGIKVLLAATNWGCVLKLFLTHSKRERRFFSFKFLLIHHFFYNTACSLACSCTCRGATLRIERKQHSCHTDEAAQKFTYGWNWKELNFNLFIDFLFVWLTSLKFREKSALFLI